MKDRNSIDCHRCCHYYVTWDRNFPHGCRYMKFKSRKLPSADVLASSGNRCLSFVPLKRSLRPTR